MKKPRRTYRPVRTERTYSPEPEHKIDTPEHKARVTAQEKRVAADLARMYKAPKERYLFGVPVRFRRGANGWEWRLLAWDGNGHRRSRPWEGPFDDRPAAVKNAARFLAKAVLSTTGIDELTRALQNIEDNHEREAS